MFNNGSYVFTGRFTQHDLCRMLPFAIIKAVLVRRHVIGVFEKYKR